MTKKNHYASWSIVTPVCQLITPFLIKNCFHILKLLHVLRTRPTFSLSTYLLYNKWTTSHGRPSRSSWTLTWTIRPKYKRLCPLNLAVSVFQTSPIQPYLLQSLPRHSDTVIASFTSSRYLIRDIINWPPNCDPQSQQILKTPWNSGMFSVTKPIYP